ncbi:MAG: hypothetical protein AAB534_01190 [Patescibacteria group bacterium]
MNNNGLLSKAQLDGLTRCIQDTHREQCEDGECLCVTTEEHERRLAEGRLRRNRPASDHEQQEG